MEDDREDAARPAAAHADADAERRGRGRRGQRRRRRLALKLALALFVGLGALEVGIRTIDAAKGRTVAFYIPLEEGAKELFEPHPFTGFLYRPGATREKGPDGSGQNLRINNLAMRGADLAPEKPPGVYRILCLGGSTTAGTDVTEDERTYPARLEHYLNEVAPAGRRYEVGNCGVNGWGTTESLINLALRLVEFEPDAILVYHAANDARPIQAEGFRPDYAHMRRAWTEPCVGRLDMFLLKHWRTWAWLTRGVDPELQYRALGNPMFVPGYKDLHVRSDREVREENIDVYLRNLEHMAVVARSHGIQPVFSTFAVCSAKDRAAERFLETVARMNARLVELAERIDVPVLDVAGALDERCELFTDWMHLNDAGSDAHARRAFEEARRLGVFGLGS